MCKELCISCCDIPIKRYLLPTTGLVIILIFEDVRNFIYLPLVVCYVSFIIFINFPSILYFTSSKPLYYQDMFIDPYKLPVYDVSNEIKEKFKQILEWSLIITSTLLLGALSDFWLYKTSNLNSNLEILGVTGGMLKCFQTTNTIIASILMHIARSYIVIENDNLRKLESIEVNIELDDLELNRIDTTNINNEVDKLKIHI